MSHYFLPRFLKSLKSRKEVIDFNLANLEKIQESYKKKHIFLNELLKNNLILIKNFLSKESVLLVSNRFDIKSSIINAKIAITLYDFVLYCNVNTMNCIRLELKLTNLYFKEKN